MKIYFDIMSWFFMFFTFARDFFFKLIKSTLFHVVIEYALLSYFLFYQAKNLSGFDKIID